MSIKWVARQCKPVWWSVVILNVSILRILFLIHCCCQGDGMSRPQSISRFYNNFICLVNDDPLLLYFVCTLKGWSPPLMCPLLGWFLSPNISNFDLLITCRNCLPLCLQTSKINPLKYSQLLQSAIISLSSQVFESLEEICEATSFISVTGSSNGKAIKIYTFLPH